MTTQEIKNLLKLYKEFNEINLETIERLESSDDYPNNLELIREMIRNAESMCDFLKIVERYFRWTTIDLKVNDSSLFLFELLFERIKIHDYWNLWS